MVEIDVENVDVETEETDVLDEEVNTNEQTADQQTDKGEQSEPDVRDHEFDKARQQEQQELANSRRRIAELEEQVVLKQQEKESGSSDEEEDPFDTIKVLKEELEGLKTSLSQTSAVVRDTQVKEVYNKFYRAMDDKYGPECRNTALEYLKQEAVTRGFTLVGNDRPTVAQELDWLRVGYAEAALSAKGRLPKEKVVVKADVSKNGRTAPKTGAFKGTPEEVLADMKKNNRSFKNVLIDK